MPGLAVEPDSVTLAYIGETAVFTVEVTGYKWNAKARWESADTEVFTVDSAGEVTARGNGRAVLVARPGNIPKATAVVRVEQQVASPASGSSRR